MSAGNVKGHIKNNRWAEGSFPNTPEGEEVFTITQERFDAALKGYPKLSGRMNVVIDWDEDNFASSMADTDVLLTWMPSALAAREKGLPVVNIAQPFKTSGLMLTCWKDSGIESVADFPGKTIGVWFFGNEYPFLSWMSQEGISTDGGEDGVTVLKQGFNVDPLLQRQADCISTMTYNEYGQVLDAGVSPDELITFMYEDQGVATLEDGIYALEDNLEDPVFVDKMVRFVRASMEGWKWAEANPEAAANIVLDNDETGAQTEAAQIRMMGEIAKLTAGSNGALDPADYQRTVDTLLAGGSDPVISAAPEGAWTSVITDAALN